MTIQLCFPDHGSEANTIDRGREGAKRAADGLGRRYAFQRVPRHRHVFRRHLQGGRLLDLYGTNVDKHGQVL